MLQKSISNFLCIQSNNNISNRNVLTSTRYSFLYKMRKNKVQVLEVSEAPREDDDEPDRRTLEQKHNNDQDQGRTVE